MGYYYETAIGIAEIIFRDGRWRAKFLNQQLATYHSPTQAAEDLVRSRITINATEFNLSSLNIPPNLEHWHRRPAHQSFPV
jgi:hypothetical protein